MARLIHPLMYMVHLRQLHEARLSNFQSSMQSMPNEKCNGKQCTGQQRELVIYLCTCTFVLCCLLALVDKITFRGGNCLRPLFLSFVFCTLLTDLKETLTDVSWAGVNVNHSYSGKTSV